MMKIIVTIGPNCDDEESLIEFSKRRIFLAKWQSWNAGVHRKQHTYTESMPCLIYFNGYPRNKTSDV